jgi:hypothetical protein
MAAMPGFAIRNIVASTSGRRVLLGAFENDVVLHDLSSGRTSEAFKTTFDAGGNRLALSDELDIAIAGAYYRHGVAAYSGRTHELLWRRADVKKVQTITLSRDGETAYCGLEAGPLAVLDVRTGEMLRTIRGARSAHESAFDDASLLETRPLQVVDRSGKRICTITLGSFATLSAAFAPNVVCISEAAGPVRCIRLRDGLEVWRYRPPNGAHVLTLAYDARRECISGVEWPFEKGGAKRLKSWRCSDGEAVSEHVIGEPSEECFALSGGVLVLADGRVLDTATSEQVAEIA